jgi:hypothetical protein
MVLSNKLMLVFSDPPDMDQVITFQFFYRGFQLDNLLLQILDLQKSINDDPFLI